MPTISFNTNFPGYEVLGEIGRSNARVLKARHTASGDLVAIKHFSLNTDADTLRRFERESKIMTQMAHPNIVKVREVRLNADLPYIVLDYIDGGNVRQLLNEQGSLPVEMTIRLGLQVINAFRLIHAEGIIHRDVKPENILYHRLASGELHFLLTDFGVARLHEQPVTMTGQSLMTYEYAAPEQFDNPKNVTEAVDYYALGVVLYECLTGQVPFPMRGETGIITFMNAVLTTPPPTPSLASNQPVPRSLTTLVKQLLVKNPADRVQNPDVVRLALKQAEVEQLHYENKQSVSAPVADNLPVNRTRAVESTAPPAERRTSEPPRKNVTRKAEQVAAKRSLGLVPIALLVIVLVLAGLGVYWFTNQKEAPVATTQQAFPTDDPETPADTVSKQVKVITEAERQAAQEAARQQYMEKVEAATKLLEADTFGGRRSLLGGVSGLNVQLRNLSTITFTQVAVRVRYIKESGELYKSTVMYFNHLTPNSTIVREAPDSPRGTRFSAEVLRADAENPDSLATVPPLTH